MAILTGFMRLGRDAEVRQTPGGDSVANLALAYELSKKGTNGKRPTVWVDAALWGKRAETLAPYLLKGTPLVVTIQDPMIRTFKKKDGTEGYTLAGQVIDITFAGSAPEPKPDPKPTPKPASSSAAGGFVDDDIPFCPIGKRQAMAS